LAFGTFFRQAFPFNVSDNDEFWLGFFGGAVEVRAGLLRLRGIDPRVTLAFARCPERDLNARFSLLPADVKGGRPALRREDHISLKMMIPFNGAPFPVFSSFLASRKRSFFASSSPHWSGRAGGRRSMAFAPLARSSSHRLGNKVAGLARPGLS